MKNRKKSENTQDFSLPSLYKSPSAEVSYIEGLEHEALYSLFIVGLVVTAIIGVINGNLSKLYSDKRVSIVDEELLSTKTHDQYNITSKDLEETIERLMSLDSARAMRRDEDAEAEARIEINNIIDTL